MAAEVLPLGEFPHIDVMAGTAPTSSRWDRGDHDGAIRALAAVLEQAGLPGFAPAERHLERAEELASAGRAERDRAAQQLEVAIRR